MGDAERLQSFYQDRGFAAFELVALDVSISPDKQKVYVTYEINEGEVYSVNDIQFSGNMVLPEDALRELVLIKPQQTFNRKLLTQSTELMALRLAQDGYTFAEIQPLPEFDDDTNEVAIVFQVTPGNQMYVRRIEFLGVDDVDDEVFRREMRQMEGSYLSSRQAERSKQRIQRLPFVKNVRLETVPVEGSDDLVDLKFIIEKGLPAQIGGGVGYSGSDGITLNGNLTHTNFLGKGDRIRAELVTTDFRKSLNFSHTDPYVTPDGVSRTVSLAYSDIDRLFRTSSLFQNKNVRVGLEYGWPLNEYSRLQVGGAIQNTELLSEWEFGSRLLDDGMGGTIQDEFFLASEQAVSFVTRNGDPFAENTPVGGDCRDFGRRCGTDFLTGELFTTWSWDSRDRLTFPRKGSRHRLSLLSTVPGSDVSFYTAKYDFLHLIPLGKQWRLSWRGEFAFGEPLGDTTDLPPYKHFFAGGADSVRGFETNSLGPRDTTGRAYGGNLLTVSQLELIFPTPESLRDAVQFSAFYDMGNVFYTGSGGSTFYEGYQSLNQPLSQNPLGDVIDYGFDYDDIRHSAGLAVTWQSPLGLFKFSYAVPLNESSGSRYNNGLVRRYEDEVERFQFSVGNAF